MPPRITVVTVSIPERWDLLLEAAASLENQTYQDFVWLLRMEKPPEFGVRHVVKQRNAILKAVDTEWIAVLDDDDRFDPEYLAIMAEELKDNDVVYSYCRERSHAQSEFNEAKFREALRTGLSFIDGECLIRTQVLRSAGGYPAGDVAEDFMLWGKLYNMGARFHCVPIELRDHRAGYLAGRSRTWRTVIS